MLSCCCLIVDSVEVDPAVLSVGSGSTRELRLYLEIRFSADFNVVREELEAVLVVSVEGVGTCGWKEGGG